MKTIFTGGCFRSTDSYITLHCSCDGFKSIKWTVSLDSDSRHYLLMFANMDSSLDNGLFCTSCLSQKTNMIMEPFILKSICNMILVGAKSREISFYLRANGYYEITAESEKYAPTQEHVLVTLNAITTAQSSSDRIKRAINNRVFVHKKDIVKDANGYHISGNRPSCMFIDYLTKDNTPSANIYDNHYTWKQMYSFSLEGAYVKSIGTEI